MLANRARRLTGALVLGRRPLPIAARPCVNLLLAQRWPNSGRSSSSVATSAAAPPLPIAVVAQQQVDRLMITEAAAKRILHLNSSKGQQRLLRLSVEPGGCSGFSYKFNMAEAATVDAEEDVIFEKLGARVVVDGSSLALLDGATVDFKDEMAKSAFIVSANPMSDASCGCGTSFTAKEVL